VFELRIRRSGLPGESGGEIPYQVAVLDDVTERQRARHLLEHFNEQLRREVETKTAALRRTNRRLQLEVDAHRRDTEALRLSEYRYHSFVEKTRTGIYLAERGRLTYCNKRFAEMLGYEEGELLGKRIVAVLGKHYAHPPNVASDTGDPHSGRECLVYGKNGRRIWLDITEAPYADGERDIIIANVFDITARKDFEDRLVASKRRTDQLSEQLLIAQERERARISRELHDGVGQRINAIKLMLDNVVSECKQDSDSKYRDALVELGGSLRETVEEVRRVSMALRPSILDDLGIAATLTWFVREFKRAVPGMEIECDLSLDESNMEPLLKTELFRITQEAFNNIAKHAGACRIRFSLVAGDGALVLRIEDDGQGILSVQEPGEHGVGLHSMQERAELTGGDLFVVTRDGAGTTVIGVWRSR
jgi:PAS domain S-box-containing protein